MINLSDKYAAVPVVHSSKGNQLKWERQGIWYKADYTGYEGLSEYMVSELLRYSNMEEDEFILYETEEILYKSTRYLGCKSKSFLPQGWQIITLERLFYQTYAQSLYKSIYRIQETEERCRFLVQQVEQMTGLKNFGAYLVRLLTIDALFLNEDRHTHNIAVLCDDLGEFHYCPIFDNGAALLSDLIMDYPMNREITELIPQVGAKTLCLDFDEQLDAVESIYGQTLHFSFNEHTIDELLEKEQHYSDEIKARVKQILLQQRRKYQYLFR